MKMTKTISAIIVNWNGEEVISDCLDSIYEANFDKDELEVIVVDNDSKDGSVKIIEKNYPDVILIKEKKNHGFAEGNNIGYRIATGKFIAMINNDLVIDREWFNQCMKAFEDSRIGGVCGTVFEWNDGNPKFDKSNKISTTILKINMWTGRATNYNHVSQDTTDMGYLSGCSMIVRKDIIDKIGFLDKEYFAYYEETDLCIKIRKAGYLLKYLSNAYSWHRVAHSTSKMNGPSEFNMKMMARNRIRFMMKNANIVQKMFFPAILSHEWLRLEYMIYVKYRKFPVEKHFYKTIKKYFILGIKSNIFK